MSSEPDPTAAPPGGPGGTATPEATDAPGGPDDPGGPDAPGEPDEPGGPEPSGTGGSPGPGDAPRTARHPAARSLADELRSWPAERLVALLRARPDLTVPLPTDLTSLAARASSRAGVQRALDGLDTPALQVLEVIAVLPEPASPTEVRRCWGAPAAAVLTRLRDLALVWGPQRSVWMVRTVRDLLGPYPAGLGPPLAEALGRRSPQRLTQLLEDLGLAPSADPGTAVPRLTAHLADPGTVRELLDRAPEGVTALLERLVWGPPVGQVSAADRPVRSADATGPVEWLLARGLLAVADSAHVVLPREIGLALRDGRVHRTPEPTAPPLRTRGRPEAAVTGAASGAAAEAVRLVDALGESLGTASAPVLRSGGLGVRELRRLATALDIPEAIAATAVEVAFASGLVADDGEADPRWAPTPAFDGWRAEEVAGRWATLAGAWLGTTRCPGLVGTRDERDSPRQALGPGLDRAAAPVVRLWTLRALAGAPAPTGQVAVVGAESLRAGLDWAIPRRAGRARDALVGWALEEAAWLGVTGAGALAPHARPLLADPPDPVAAAEALATALPDPVAHVLLQADLTAVAPGPPEPGLARELELAADVESRGGATVYRFSATSVRRAMDAGRTGDDLLDLLARHSPTEVPQPLRYLVTDTARRHGRVRVGTAGAYLRAEDEATLAAVLADRRAASLGLRRLAPTVLAAQSGPGPVLEVLRELGLAPAAEGPDGELLVGRPQVRRTPPRTRPQPVSPLPPSPPAQTLAATVDALLRADRAVLDHRTGTAGAHGAGPAQAPELGANDPVQVLALLRDAAARREPVWIGYADAAGRTAPRLVQPLHVEGGRVDAFDRAAQRMRSFSVHRVTGVAPAPG